MKRKYCILILIVSLFSCAGGSERYFGPAEKSDIYISRTGSGILRTGYCDISVEGLDSKTRKRLLDFPMFRGSGDGFPSIPVFCIMIINTWNKPIQVNRLEIITDKGVIPPEFFDYVSDKDYAGKRFAVNLRELWKTRRILKDVDSVRELDFESGTVEYSFNFIAPGDRILMFRTFGWISSDSGRKRLRIGIKYHEMEKVIDFDVAESEYYEPEPDIIRKVPEVMLKHENR